MVIFSSHPLQHLLFVDFFNNGHSDPVRGYLIVVLICISLIKSTFEHLFMCLLAICLLWRNVCLGLLPSFWLGCLFFWYWAVWATYIFWSLTLCQLLHWQLFSPILKVLFSSCLQFPLMGKGFKLFRSHFFVCLFVFISTKQGEFLLPSRDEIYLPSWIWLLYNLIDQ